MCIRDSCKGVSQCNEHGKYNFRGARCGVVSENSKHEKTIAGITPVSESKAKDLLDWKVPDNYSGSDHQYITLRLLKQ